MKKLVIIVILIIFFSFCITVLLLAKTNLLRSDSDIISSRTYPEVNSSAGPWFSFSELTKSNLSEGIYNVRASVVYLNVCMCEPGVQCSVCAPDSIVLSSITPGSINSSHGSVSGENNPYSENTIIVYVDDPDQFEVGKKYSFTLSLVVNTFSEDQFNIFSLLAYSLE